MGWRTGRDFETPLVAVFRCTRVFYEEHKDWVCGLVSESGAPMLVEILSGRVHYWIAKIDLATIDGQGRPIENPTVQIDVESADRFGISYHQDGEEVFPPILHCSPTGSVERVICALLEQTARQDVPQFPAWLSADAGPRDPRGRAAPRLRGRASRTGSTPPASGRTSTTARRAWARRSARPAWTGSRSWPWSGTPRSRLASSTVTIRKLSGPEQAAQGAVLRG